ncbi:hypothetical protein AN957_06840 [Cytobacillus solani]|uniref:Uncharacterized protein n=1 Tax=Cytobacillus solani TaxID=1637975 RepID=A0A0Q3SG51_9BACI|nr:hypothetical protein AMS60_01650 [Bacillus sp. FJAT-21945]KQL18324.1 hypothetical protein AN957_06840 [Cytobacillus solani]
MFIINNYFPQSDTFLDSALNRVAKILLEGHLKGCVVDRHSEGDDEVLDELVVTIQKLMKNNKTL